MLSQQETLNKVTVVARDGKREVEQYLKEKGSYFSKRREREELKTRIEAFRQQLAEEERREEEGE